MEDPGAARGTGFDWEEAEDLTVLSRRDLAWRLESLCEEERALDYRLQILRGRIELIRAELSGRETVTLSREDLAWLLLGYAPAKKKKKGTGSAEEVP